MGFIGHNATLAEAVDMELTGKIFDYLAAHPGGSGIRERVREGIGVTGEQSTLCT